MTWWLRKQRRSVQPPQEMLQALTEHLAALIQIAGSCRHQPYDWIVGHSDLQPAQKKKRRIHLGGRLLLLLLREKIVQHLLDFLYRKTKKRAD